jgi:hypothetical protein
MMDATLGKLLELPVISWEQAEQVLAVLRTIKEQADKGVFDPQGQDLVEDEAYYRAQYEALPHTPANTARSNLLLVATFVKSGEQYSVDMSSKIRLIACMAAVLDMLIPRYEDAVSRWTATTEFYVNYQGLNPAGTAYIAPDVSQELCEETKGPYATLDEARAARQEVINSGFDL